MTAPTYTFSADFSLVQDQIRQLIGDVDVVTDPILSDEAIAFFYAQAGSDLLGGAVKAAKAAAAKLARECDLTASKSSAKQSQRHAAMLNVIAVLEDEQARDNASYTIPDVGQVVDVAGYPLEFEPSDLAGPDWADDDE
jgi:hypothetical protein